MRKQDLRQIVVAATGLMVLALGGCGQTVPPGFTSVDFQQPARDVVKVEERHASQSIFINPRNGALSPSERQRVDIFVSDFGGDRPESVHVDLHGNGPSEEFSGVMAELIAQGVEREKIRLFPGEHVPATGSARFAVTLAASRAVAIAPDCPGWTDHVAAPADNRAVPNFGCSTVSNLGAMVADPADFAKGRYAPTTNSAPAINAVQRYRTDTVKPLPVQGNFSTTGSNGAPAGGGGGGAPPTGGGAQ